MGQYLVGIDIVDTFTNRVAPSRKGGILATRALSTPGNFPKTKPTVMRASGPALAGATDISFSASRRQCAAGVARDLAVSPAGNTMPVRTPA